MEIKLKPYQAEFLSCLKRFPAIIAAIGTGKTLLMLLKIWKYCKKYPNSLALIVRKEYTDLRDSTIKDFQTYFDVSVDNNKEYKFDNGSTIMFRHGDEMAVLKNMNLSIAGIEQAEEFGTDEVFVFIRDRLRRQNAPYRQLIVIANANGHNWLWRLFINGAEKTIVIDEPTGQIIRERGEYIAVEANMFANEDNLPKDFIDDHIAMKDDAPNHYMRYVMNCHEELEADDLLFDSTTVYDSPKIVLPYQNRVIKRVCGLDVARFGNDETVFTIIEQKDIYRWEQVFLERYKHKDTVWTSGYAMELERRFNLDLTVVDDIGVGGGVTDNLTNNGGRILPFIANSEATASKQRDYADSNTEGFCMMADLIGRAWLKLLPDHEQAEQIMSTRFTFRNGIRIILTKEQMRIKYKEIKSPDIAKALMMAVFGTDKRPIDIKDQSFNHPAYGRTDEDMNLQFDGQLLPAYGKSI